MSAATAAVFSQLNVPHYVHHQCRGPQPLQETVQDQQVGPITLLFNYFFFPVSQRE